MSCSKSKQIKHAARQRALRILLTVLGDPDGHCSNLSNKYFLKLNFSIVIQWEQSPSSVQTGNMFSALAVREAAFCLLCAAVYTQMLGYLSKWLSISWAALSLWQTWWSIIQALLHQRWPEYGYFGGALFSGFMPPSLSFPWVCTLEAWLRLYKERTALFYFSLE